ncbi:histidinol-phosphate transaminase [Dimargaris verticillata]|uniref:histidinol-phosphate transaminase n=1 Tax=Dimargaris verticillata TaxID=2761393 RepID=A0A9W8B788_9FUNG|nr:histidinol-phosphate transaminase [Dimargaris verticillata]
MASEFDLTALVRPNIRALKPYRCARDDYSSGVLLDANENSLGAAVPEALAVEARDQSLNRYPDPLQVQVKEQLVQLRGLPQTDHVFLGVGSDEVIDLLVRVICVPGQDKILITPPTYGMYGVTAQVNDVGVVKVPLLVDTVNDPANVFQLNVPAMLAATAQDPAIKLVFVCSPGNPTGTLIHPDAVKKLLTSLDQFRGIVVVDEAYIDFVPGNKSLASWVTRFPNLVVLQTMSKSFGLAGIRLGLGIAQPAIIQYMNNTKAPYNISTPTARVALAALNKQGLADMRKKVATLSAQRQLLLDALPQLPGVGQILGTNDANFVVCQVVDATGAPSRNRALQIYQHMAQKMGVVVRYRGNEYGCDGCLRITVGSPEENQLLLQRMTEALALFQ